MQRRIGFLDIAGTVAEVLDAMGTHPADTLDEVMALDAAARRDARAPDRRARRLSTPNRNRKNARHHSRVLASVLAFIVVLGVLVFVHELGHYLAARWRGVHVEVFSIGFGPAIATWRDRVGTVWKLAWLPLGGYVKLHGQERPEDVVGEVRPAGFPATFHEKSVSVARHRRRRRTDRQFPAGDGAVRAAVRHRRPADHPARSPASAAR